MCTVDGYLGIWCRGSERIKSGDTGWARNSSWMIQFLLDTGYMLHLKFRCRDCFAKSRKMWPQWLPENRIILRIHVIQGCVVAALSEASRPSSSFYPIRICVIRDTSRGVLEQKSISGCRCLKQKVCLGGRRVLGQKGWKPDEGLWLNHFSSNRLVSRLLFSYSFGPKYLRNINIFLLSRASYSGNLATVSLLSKRYTPFLDRSTRTHSTLCWKCFMRFLAHLTLSHSLDSILEEIFPRRSLFHRRRRCRRRLHCFLHILFFSVSCSARNEGHAGWSNLNPF